MAITHNRAVGKIIGSQWKWIQDHFTGYQQRMFKALKECRTSAMGGTQYACTTCGGEHITYKSCRNRHCPNCQNTQREEWITARTQELIQTVYHHVVFTLPEELNVICLRHQREMYAIIFRVAWLTLDSFGCNHKYLGAQVGATMTLHTWDLISATTLTCTASFLVVASLYSASGRTPKEVTNSCSLSRQ